MPPDDQQSEDQYFARYTSESEKICEDLTKIIEEFKGLLSEILENVFNKENIQRVGGASDKKSEEDRRGESFGKIKEIAIAEFVTKTSDKTTRFETKFSTFKNEKSD